MRDDEALVRDEDSTRTPGRREQADAELERKVEELQEFRDAGVLTDAELEERKAMIRWHLP
jgi:hypothetical protein